MSSHKDVKIIAIVGMTGSGKSEVVNYLTEKGYPKVYFGGIILNALDKAGLGHTPENEKTMRESLRNNEGMDFAAKRINKQIHNLINSGQHKVIADGLYSWSEYKTMKHEFPGELTLVAVISPRKMRYYRLANRPVRPLTEEEAKSRDWAEIENIEKGGPIAIADYSVINDGSLEKLHQQVDEILQEIKFEE